MYAIEADFDEIIEDWPHISISVFDDFDTSFVGVVYNFPVIGLNIFTIMPRRHYCSIFASQIPRDNDNIGPHFNSQINGGHVEIGGNVGGFYDKSGVASNRQLLAPNSRDYSTQGLGK
jgi:hypothetical protein